MTQEKQQYLQKKFPKLYGGNERNSPYALFGFECDDGWFRIILWLSKAIQNRIDTNNRWAEKYPDQYNKIEQVKVVQVKEKFGTLRYYYSGGDQEISGMISFVEYISAFICEKTGKTEDIGFNKKGWVKTHHISLAKGDDFQYIDDEDLRKILS